MLAIEAVRQRNELQARRLRWHCFQPTGDSSQVSLFRLNRQDRDLLARQDAFSLKLFSMLRFGTVLVLAATALSGCSIDVESLKDCKDKDGKPLPEWVCRKDSDEKSD